ncbi:hypothetical protein [Streptomyces sp. NPDC001828]|uniref:hypothetical protein n=1 Tax=Streptomyces sp. NPDC001828 TaxID=3364615 RepID=UPI0036CF81F4
MFLDLSAYDWILIAAVVTPVHVGVMRWCMPTAKSKKSVSFIPLVGGAFLWVSAAVKGFTAAETLFLYSSILLIFVIAFAPVRKRVAADIRGQERNPGIKVQPDMFALWWIFMSIGIAVLAVIAAWMSQKNA